MTDVYCEVMRTIWDHNLHFGLWTSEEDESPNRVAAERMTALHIDKLGARHGWRVLDMGRRVGTSAFRLAEAVYREDLKQYPQNGWSLFGLAQSLKAQGKLEEAAEVQKQFDAAWARADVMLAASRF